METKMVSWNDSIAMQRYTLFIANCCIGYSLLWVGRLNDFSGRFNIHFMKSYRHYFPKTFDCINVSIWYVSWMNTFSQNTNNYQGKENIYFSHTVCLTNEIVVKFISLFNVALYKLIIPGRNSHENGCASYSLMLKSSKTEHFHG